MPARSIGIVGSGPMAIYLLKHLARTPDPLDIQVFEAAQTAGRGMPYSEGMNADYMLCNAFSREIPDLTRSFYDWLQDRPDRELSAWELSHDDVSPRAFYPRLLLGEYLESEFAALCARARAAGHRVTVHTGCRVTDLIPAQDTVTIATPDRDFPVDCAVIATGHSWPEAPRLGEARLVSPWPHTNVTALPPGPIGVLGSSLSAVDVVLALGHAHGRFEEDDQRVSWAANPGAEALHVTMLSHKGIMPEGDFYYPFPYQPLSHIGAEAVQAEVRSGQDGLLERVFALLIREIEAEDPAYLDGLGPEARTIPGFGEGYFAHRREIGGLKAVRESFAEARASMRRNETVAHRYALLRGHEHFDLALRHLGDDDWSTFIEHLMPVFGDCYAAIPHLSLARLLAMDEKGVLDLVATGEDAEFRQTTGGGVAVTIGDSTLSFDAMVDARGQAPADMQALPFPSLIDVLEDDDAPLCAPFRLPLRQPSAAPVYCLAMPQVLQRHPFAQGLSECAELTQVTADDLTARLKTGLQAAEA